MLTAEKHLAELAASRKNESCAVGILKVTGKCRGILECVSGVAFLNCELSVSDKLCKEGGEGNNARLQFNAVLLVLAEEYLCVLGIVANYCGSTRSIDSFSGLSHSGAGLGNCANEEVHIIGGILLVLVDSKVNACLLKKLNCKSRLLGSAVCAVLTDEEENVSLCGKIGDSRLENVSDLLLAVDVTALCDISEHCYYVLGELAVESRACSCFLCEHYGIPTCYAVGHTTAAKAALVNVLDYVICIFDSISCYHRETESSCSCCVSLKSCCVSDGAHVVAHPAEAAAVYMLFSFLCKLHYLLPPIKDRA